MSTYEISKSSLLSLKAEILRKQEELTKVKVENEQKIKTIRKNNPLEFKNKGVEARGRNDLSDDDLDLLKLSSTCLEAKAALYEKLAKGSNHNKELTSRYLVRFDNKNTSQTDPDRNVPSDDENHFSDEYDPPTDPSEEWVEYVDCLGRTRTCLRKDLEYLKSKDADLKVIAEERKQAKPEDKEVEHVEEKLDDENDKDENDIEKRESELISGDMRREMLRKQWEKEEEELMDRTNVHYQNVLFNEARTHGVGYYAFSKDEEEREKQLAALKKLRQETEQQQKKAQDLKALREKQLAARMKAARNRKRARMGLPPEEDEPVSKPEDNKPEHSDKDEEEKKRLEEAEKMLQKARQKHIRPWDIGKEGVKEHYEMSQEEWNEKKRKERIEEFAPPSEYKKKRDFRSTRIADAPSEENSSLRFSSKKKTKLENINPYKNIKQGSDNYESDEVNSSFSYHSSIAEECEKTRKQSKTENIEDSIDAGLRFLRKQAERGDV